MIYFSVLLWTMSLTSCLYNLKESITGNGNVVNEKRNVGAFESLEVCCNLNAYVTFGNELSVSVEADENLQEIIRTVIDNKTLKIYTRPFIRKAKAKKVHITVPWLKSIEVSSASSCEGKNILKIDELKLDVSSAANLKLEAETRILRVEVSSGSKAELRGSAEKLYAEVSSAGSLEAYELRAKDCDVEASSAGHAAVYAIEELSASASSAGSITYKGDVKNTHIEQSSAGSVKQRR